VSDGIFFFTCNLFPKEFHFVPIAFPPFPFSFNILGFWFSNMNNGKEKMFDVV
jgi:hypothetical protein